MRQKYQSHRLKAQISFEFIMIFVFLLLAFLGFVAFMQYNIDKSGSSKDYAEKLVREIKVAVITASVSKSDFETEISIPKKFGNTEIEFFASEDPDNFIDVKSGTEVLARAFLPKVDSVIVADPQKDTLKIQKYPDPSDPSRVLITLTFI